MASKNFVEQSSPSQHLTAFKFLHKRKIISMPLAFFIFSVVCSCNPNVPLFYEKVKIGKIVLGIHMFQEKWSSFMYILTCHLQILEFPTYPADTAYLSPSQLSVHHWLSFLFLGVFVFENTMISQNSNTMEFCTLAVISNLLKALCFSILGKLIKTVKCYPWCY